VAFSATYGPSLRSTDYTTTLDDAYFTVYPIAERSYSTGPTHNQASHQFLCGGISAAWGGEETLSPPGKRTVKSSVAARFHLSRRWVSCFEFNYADDMAWFRPWID